ncbi:MAG TPA: SET domain-containing protein-lysine N-methyltransferase [Bacteriovoracaceae bacterium]|nr:SET domain-containing protein-lysine N-methyltransferase [Bacteriovoracaceae bacterium]
MKKTKIKVNSLKGRGVFADEIIRKNVEIETCHLIVINLAEVGRFLEGYVFDYGPRKVALALGNGSLYNHSNEPNAICYMDRKNKVLSFEALKMIKKGEEISINYGYSKADREKFHII